MAKLLYLTIYFLACSMLVYGQDHIYSQFYNSPVYLNPALNGQFEGDLRMNAIYRNQWSSVAGPLTYYSVSIDYNVPKFGGGFGLLATRSSEGTAYLSKTNISGIYSYSVDFNNSVLSFGIQGGLTNRRVDTEKLLFGDQLDESIGIIPGAVSNSSVFTGNNRFFFDAGAGANLVIGNFMTGLGIQHLNRPNESLTGLMSKLPVRYNAYASYRISLDRNDDEESPAVIPSVVYYNQATSRSYSAGLQYKNRSINVGLWYRGEGNKHQDAVVVSLILDLFVKRDYYDKVRFGFSHDATTSGLQYTRTSGTTEGALSYETTFPGSANSGGYRVNRKSYGKRCYDFY